MADAASSILSALVSSANIKNIGKEAGASTADVKKVLTSALPSLLQGASNQVSGASTAAGFLQALSSHASDKAGTIDLSDGAKILSHLLGSSMTSTTNAVAKESGVDKATTKSILAAAAPILLSVLGQQTNASSSSSNAVAALLGSVVSNNMGSILTGLLGGGTSTQSSSSAKPGSSKPGSNKKQDLAGAAVNILGSLLK
ncbi:MAG: DUF937 domain-containing protein [Treponema sp.]|nr:DUF937 domain-containing protein [Treponema sp.]